MTDPPYDNSGQNSRIRSYPNTVADLNITSYINACPVFWPSELVSRTKKKKLWAQPSRHSQ